MEDDKGLDLSLSLPCGWPSAASKGKTVIGSDVRAYEADNRDSKLIDDFKNFLDGSNHKEESAVVSRSRQSKPEETFYDLSTGPSNMEVGNKHKNTFDEINNQKRHEKDGYLANLHINPRDQHISIPTNDGSIAENEGVADSEADRISEATGVDLKNQRAFTIGLFLGQSADVVNLSYSLSVKESNSNLGSQQPMIPANLSLMFGYTPVQAATVSAAVTPVNEPNPFDRTKREGKMFKEDGSSMHTEVNTKGINVIDQSKPDGLPPDYPAIRPGIAADLKIGGNGSAPNLPWVSSTGPNGKTISGVTYKYSGSQIRIVCACHGSHMSPEEFVRHASEEQSSLNGAGAGLLSFSNGYPTASAQN